MPLIMDDQTYNMDVDDLFGDSEQVALPTITAPPVKGLARRLDELSASGCCQKIAWSKTGCVAYITPDGFTVNLRVFSRDSATGKWDLGGDTALELPHGHDDFQYVHVSWSHLGNDLVVMDAAGHVMIFSCNMALDRMVYVRADLSQPEAEIDAVVGMHWLGILPYEQKSHIAWSATGEGNSWKFKAGGHVFNDAHHPMEGKASLVYLKRHGELRLRFQQHDNSWHEAGAVLGPMISTREPFTHAAFASNNDNTLLLAACDVSGKLHLYRIEIKWHVPPTKPGQPPKAFEKPDIQVAQLGIGDDCYPVSSTIVDGDLGDGGESNIRIPAELIHLHFLPITPEQNDGTLPTIQAVFSTPPNIVSFDQTQHQQNPFSIIVRWEVHHTQQNQLHSSLDKVTSKKKSISSAPARDVFTLKRQPDLIMHSVVLSFFPLWFNMILAFCHSDGTIEFRKRSTMQSITPDYNTETVTSLLQAGFSFPTLEPSLHFCLSPSHCIATCMQQDGTIKTQSMEYTYGSLATDDDDPKHSAALAAVVLQLASATNQYFSGDDIFSIIGELSEKRKSDFIHLMFEGLNVNIDCGIDDSAQNHLMLLGRSPFFVKTLSAAHLLGLRGSVERSVTSKMAWIILNIKYITQILTTIARMHGQIDKNPLRPEVVPQFIGVCRWIMHFMVYMIDELMAVAFALKHLPPASLDRQTIEAKIHELNKPAVLIFLSSFPRMMMRIWPQPLTWVVRTAINWANGAPTLEVRKIYSPLHQAISDIPFEHRFFDALVNEAQLLVRGTYKRANLNEGQRNKVEHELILGRIPEVLVPVARRLLTETLFNENQQNGCLLDKIDASKVMFFDTTWLGFQASNRSKEWSETHVVDVSQKMIIRGTGAQSHPTGTNVANMANRGRNRSDSVASVGGGNEDKTRKLQLRKCVRCGAYMEDVTHGMPGYSAVHVSWLMGVAKHCVCGNNWMLAPEKERAK